LIKSPLNYIGGKYKLLPQILPLFPKDVNTFYDIFGGGGNVAVNVNANKVVYNDLNLKVVQILEAFKNTPTEVLLCEIEKFIYHYELSKTNREGYLKLLERYNRSENKSPVMLYTLICYAFNNQIRFNSKGEYNMPFGKDRSSFNDMLRTKFVAFCDTLHSKEIVFTNSDFREYSEVEFNESDFIYCDPPYLDTLASYNERDGWVEQDELDLYDFLNGLTAKNVRWALSNNLSANPLLSGFIKDNKLVVHEISTSYKNCNYQKKDKSEAKEVLITNFE
jgi:DNA adenine methylase Dam